MPGRKSNKSGKVAGQILTKVVAKRVEGEVTFADRFRSEIGKLESGRADEDHPLASMDLHLLGKVIPALEKVKRGTMILELTPTEAEALKCGEEAVLKLRDSHLHTSHTHELRSGMAVSNAFSASAYGALVKEFGKLNTPPSKKAEEASDMPEEGAEAHTVQKTVPRKEAEK